MESNLFEQATRSKFRFRGAIGGSLTTEDLWDLTVENLDLVFKALNAQMKDYRGESLLVNTRTAIEEELSAKIDVVKYIANVKIAERNARLAAKERKEEKQKLMGILESKQDEVLRGKSVEELASMIDKL